MSKGKKLLRFLFAILTLLPFFYLYTISCQFGFWGDWKDLPAHVVTDFTMERDGAITSVTLPYTITDGTAGESVVLTAKLEDFGKQRLYFKSVYATFRVYVNDTLFYDYSSPDDYASFLQDPPVMIATQELPDEYAMDLRLEYTYPSTRTDLILDAPMIGSYPAIFNGLTANQESFLVVYVILLVLGLFFICIGLIVRMIEQQGIFFVWLGMISLFCGVWGLGEQNITALFIHNENLIYVLTFASVYYLPVAVHCFFRSTVGYRNPRPVTICIALCMLVSSGIMLLQATSLFSLYQSLFYFQWFAVISFCFSTVYTIYEWRVHHNQMAKLFLMSWCIVIFATLAESLRFFMGYTNVYGQVAQVGLLLFILINSVVGGLLIRKGLALQAQNRRIAQEYQLMELQVAEQQRYQHLLMETRQTIRQQRHDLRHQLVVIQSLAQEGNMEKLQEYLQSIHAQIPESMQTYCENIAVNGVVSYYAGKAIKQSVAVTVELVVPPSSQHINDSNLCVIFGNLMENAVEACGRMVDGGQFIHLTSHMRNGMLVIVQNNSFEGPIRQEEDKFRSSKRDDFGIGLTSIQAVAHKHNGNATFTPNGRVFQSTVYVRV